MEMPGNVDGREPGLISSRTIKHLVVLVMVVALSLLNAYVLKTLDIVGIPFIFAAALILQLLLLVTFLFSLVITLKTPLRVMGSIGVSAARGVQENIYVRSWRTRHPRLSAWIGRRFSLQHPTGLILTSGTIAAAFALGTFLGVANAVLAKSTYAAVDQRILNLVPEIRSPGQNAFFVFFTFGASWVAIGFFLLLLGISALWKRQIRWLFFLFAGAAISTSLVSAAIKRVVGRPRPDRALGLVTENNFGFPSGHTLSAMVLGGLLAYLLVRATKPYALKLAIVLVAITTILLVGLSRIYLGAHYPSDVLGSLMLGVCILAVLITALEINERYGVFDAWCWRPSTNGPLRLAVVATLVFAGLFGARLTPLVMVASTEPQQQALHSIDSSTIAELPVYSETLTGSKMEPINFIYLGTQDQIEEMFKRAGWYKADPSTPENTLRAIVIALRNEQYLTAPVTPSYLNAEPETMAFEQPTVANTLVQRHHTRIWKTIFTVRGQPVWVATASFDRGIGVGLKSGLPTHHIDPNVDAERTYILDSLNINKPRMIRVVDPQLGLNATGDGFFTDGQAAIINVAETINH